jgi:hypothetical protein
VPQHEYTAEQFGLEFVLEGARRQRHVEELVARGLVFLFETVHERAALDSDTADVLTNQRIRDREARLHVEPQTDTIARYPRAADLDVLTGARHDAWPMAVHLE